MNHNPWKSWVHRQKRDHIYQSLYLLIWEFFGIWDIYKYKNMKKITHILDNVVRCIYFGAGVHIKNPIKNSYRDGLGRMTQTLDHVVVVHILMWDKRNSQINESSDTHANDDTFHSLLRPRKLMFISNLNMFQCTPFTSTRLSVDPTEKERFVNATHISRCKNTNVNHKERVKKKNKKTMIYNKWDRIGPLSPPIKFPTVPQHGPFSLHTMLDESWLHKMTFLFLMVTAFGW